MKKTLLALTFLSAIGIGAANAQTYLALQDFNSVTAPALPTNWSSSVAGAWATGAPNTLVPQITNFYNLNSAAHMSAVGINGATVGNNNAILSTPSFSIPAGSVNPAITYDQAFFKFRLTANPNNPETLTFVMSTDGGTTWNDVIELTADTLFTWETRTIPLTAYIGQTNLKAGFRYKNNSLAIIGAALDNIKVWTGTDMALLAAAGTSHPAGGSDYQVVNTAAVISGAVQNLGTASASGTIWYSSNGGTPVNAGPITTNPLTPGGYSNFTFNFTPTAQQTYTLKTWVVTAGDAVHTNDTTTVTVVGVSAIPTKKLVFEENTCTKCTWCPRGTVGMDEFATDHPGMAAQIALHDNFQGQDAMAPASLTPYITLLTAPGTGYSGNPSVYIDRTTYDDPGSVEEIYNSNKDAFGYANLTMGTPTVTGGTVSVPVTVSPIIAINGGKLALVVTESNVSGTTSGYNQTNTAYSGGGNGPMGGFENQPSTVPAANIRYHFVARSISPSPGGAASGLPATMAAGSTNQATLTATLDASWNQSNLQYIVLLIGSDGKVMNSVFSATPTLLPVLHTPTAIANVNAGISNAFIYPNPTFDNAFLQVDLKDATTGSIVIVDATGRTISTKDAVKLNNGKNVIEIPTAALSNGLYFVNLNTANGNISLKFQVVK